MTFDRFEVVVVPFPFTDRATRLRRPAVVLSDASFSAATGQSLLAMITRAQRSTWPGDLAVTDLAAAGLATPSLVRLKLFTLVDRLIQRRLGRLGHEDQLAMMAAASNYLGCS